MEILALPQRPRRVRNKKKVQPPPVPPRNTAQYAEAAQNLRRTNQNRARRNRNKRRDYVGGGGPYFPQGEQSRSGRKTCVISEDEYITEMTSAAGGAAVVASFPINPGQATTFPWLSKQAVQWEKYTFEMLEFYYKPEVSGFSSVGQQGKVIMYADYDASDAPPPASVSGKQIMEDTDPHVDGLPYENLLLKLSPREMHRESDAKFVRSGPLPGGSDIKTYDAGFVSVMSIGTGAQSNNLGELRVRYRVRFSVPVLPNSGSAPHNYQSSMFSTSIAEGGGLGIQVLPNNSFTTMLLTSTNTNGAGVGIVNGVMTPPPGNYIVSWSLRSVDSAGLTDSVEASFQKNGATVTTLSPRASFAANDGVHEVTLSSTAYVSANGSDAFLLSALLQSQTPGTTFGATGWVVWLAI